MEFVKYLGTHPDWHQLRLIVHAQRGEVVPWALVARQRGSMPVRDHLIVHGQAHLPPGAAAEEVLLAIVGQLSHAV